VHRLEKGFTLVELLVVVIVIGILAAIAIPNFLSSESKAREASVKSNMHTFQLAAEDFRVRYDSTYAENAKDLAASLLPGAFKNPFDKSTGEGRAWEDRESPAAEPTARPGIVSYSDSSWGLSYNIKGYGKSAALGLVLTNGR